MVVSPSDIFTRIGFEDESFSKKEDDMISPGTIHVRLILQGLFKRTQATLTMRTQRGAWEHLFGLLPKEFHIWMIVWSIGKAMMPMSPNAISKPADAVSKPTADA